MRQDSAYAGPVRLNYNAALFDVTLERSSSGTGFSRKTLNLSEEGGWNYGFDYGVRVVARPPNPNGPNCGAADDVNLYKYLLIMPDGGKKELTLMGQAQADTADGYYRVTPSGAYYSCPDYTPVGGSSVGTMTFYTTDGSYLRLEVPYNNSVGFSDQTWRLYLPDGGKVEGKIEYTTKVTDPSGWSVSYNRVFNPVGATTAFTIVEDQPPFRTITASTPSMAGSYSTDTFTWQGFGAGLSTVVTWGAIDAGVHSYTCETGSPQCQISGSRSVVTSIKIPKAADFLPDFLYEFEYRDLLHCVALKCYGQLGTMKLPTGISTDRMQVAYEYKKEGAPIEPDYLDNPVKTKTVSYPEHYEGTSPGTVPGGETVNIAIEATYSTFTNVQTGGSTTHYFSDPRLMWDPKRGLTHRTHYADGSEVEKLWWRNPPSNTAATDPGNPYVRLEVSTLPDGNGGASRSSARQSTIDRNGNSREVLDYDWTSYGSIGRSGGVLTGAVAGTLLRRVTNTYYNVTTDAVNEANAADSTTAYWNGSAPRNIRALKRSETANGSLVTQAVTEFDYAFPLFANTRTQERRWDSTKPPGLSTPLNASNAIITNYSYSCPGLVDSVTDPNGYQTKTGYTGDCLFPQYQIAAYGRPEARTTEFTYHSTGVMTRSKDIDNQVTTDFNYDRLGRRILTVEAANSQDERRTVVEYDDVNRRVVTKADRVTAGDAGLISVSYFDARGLGWLTLQSENGGVPASGCTSGCTKVERRSLAAGGFIFEAVSNPYRGDGDSNSSNDSRGFSLTRKDAAGRVREATTYAGLMAAGWPWHGGATSLGNTQTSYNGEVTTVQDAAGKIRTLQSDALGRVVSANAGGLSSTTNTYDSLGNLVGVTQGAQSRTFNYSSLSRLTSATQPENGTTLYTYDDNGNLLSRQDARGAAGRSEYLVAAGVPKAYDGLGRPRRKQIKEGAATKEVVWAWDPAIGNGKGELGSISYGTTTVSYTGYDSLGRVKAHKQRTDNVDYPFTYSYFRNDAVATIGYPSGKVVTYTVDSAGRPLTALAPGKQYVTAAKYAGHGGLRQLVMAGTNLDLSNTYNGQLQTEEIFVRKMPATSTLLKLEYDYHVSATTENNGNPRVHRINDGVTTRTQNYGFDAANRVSTMTETGGASLTFNYDAYNNRWVTVPGGSPGHAAATVSAQSAYNAATNRFVTAAMAEDYDAAGHTTVMEGGVITSDWDSEGNRIKSTNQSYTPTYYVFDGLGQRVKKENEYWGPYVHVYDAFGRLAAEYGAGVNGDCTTCYPIEDTVGSTRLVANENGDAVQRFDYTPFGPALTAYDGTWANGRAGAAWDSSTTVLHQYAGMYRDVLGLEGSADFAGARVFKRSLGRFWSPDENLVDQDAADPLSWNLYTYARNNPLRYTDPTGRVCVSPEGGEEYDDPRLPGPKCTEISAADKVKKPAAVVHGGSGAAAEEVSFALKAFFGNGPKEIEYGPGNAFTRSFQNSIGMDAIVADIKKNCQAATAGRMSVSTEEAFVNALIDGIVGGEGFYNPHAQLGAFVATYKRNNGSVNVTVTNPISLNSAAYHATAAIGIRNPKSGPLGTVHQTMRIVAPDPCRE